MVEQLYDERPVFYVSKINKAQKTHVCVECKRNIFKGDRYEYYCGFFPWWKSFKVYKTCMHCVNARMYVEEKYKIDPAFGELWEIVDELY